MVFQSYALYPHKTVRENLAFGLRRRKVDKAEIAWTGWRDMLGLGELMAASLRPSPVASGSESRWAARWSGSHEPF